MSKCVLIVDDSPLIRNAMRALLEAAGYRVCEANDGSKALEEAVASNHDLIVLDLVMPNMNGLQAAPLLRRSFPTVPIILFTMHSGAVTERQALAAGITCVMCKDGALTLVSRMSELLGKCGTANVATA